MSRDVSVTDLANQMCGELPEGYILSIHMENGAGWVELDGPDGAIDYAEFETYEGILADARRALEFALKEEAFRKAKEGSHTHD